MRQLEYRIPLLGSKRAPRPGFHVLRWTDPSAIIRVTLLLRPRPDHQGTVPVEAMTGRPIQEIHYLTRAAHEPAYAADPGDIRKVLQFAAEHHLEAEAVNETAHVVHLRGTAEAVSRAFSVDLLVYQRVGPRSTQLYRGCTGPIYISAELEGIVHAVVGLNQQPRPDRTITVFEAPSRKRPNDKNARPTEKFPGADFYR